MKLPERRILFRAINRQQNKQRPNNPRSLEELVIVSPYDKTLSNNQFSQYDSGVDDENRVIMFYTVEGLRNLCGSRFVFCDGTFKVVPNMFYQLYTFHTEVFGYVFPVAYALTMRKNEETYKLMFEQLKNHAETLHLIFSPEHVMVDFEKAAMNACTATFPNAVIRGCLFHWTQNVWRQVVALGLKVKTFLFFIYFLLKKLFI